MKNNPYIVMMRLYWRFVPSKKRALLFMGMQVCARLIVLCWPFVFGKILTIVQIGGPTMRNDIIPYMVVVFVIPVLEWLFH